MKPMTSEWVDKAEGDFAIVEREYRARKNPSYDALCFHAQQCAEKYLKARLVEAGEEPGKIHHLVTLLEDVISYEPVWAQFRQGLASLTVFAVTYRYPGKGADREMALRARRQCRAFRAAAREALGLEP